MGEIQAWDAGVGVLLEKLEDIGELDNTLVVISGDHGMPGVPGGKCNLYDYGVGVALIARGPGVKGGRVVDDFVNLMDLAPTFLEAGGVKPPDVMTGRSFLNVLRSDKSGQVDPTRTWVVTGRERHVAAAREDNLPYPHRALRTADFLYIRNFAPDRWPMGSPKFDEQSRSAVRSRRWRTTPLSPSPTWTPARRKPGWSANTPSRNGNGTTTTPSPSGPPRNSTTCRTIPTRRRTSPPIRPSPRRSRNCPSAC